jgi:hypothetical protein
VTFLRRHSCINEHAENLPVISGLSAAALNDLTLKIGDVITELDGAPVGKLIKNWRPYCATSNDAIDG